MVRREKPSDSQPYLHRVNPRIRSCQSCVRDVHVTQFQTYVVFRAEDVHAERGLIHEVHGVGAGGNVVIGKKHSACEFQVGREASVALEVPLQAERIETHAVGCVRGLESEENRDGVDGIFESSAEKARKVRSREDPSVAQAGVERACIASSAADRVAPSCPNLHFVAAFFRAGLGEAERGCDE